MKKILEMLTYRRPAGSITEAEFLDRYILPFNPIELAGNLMVVVPGDTETLFSCHTDTVHKVGGRQQVLYDPGMECAFKEDKDPLGADDTAGVWLLLEMIQAGIPGTYMFHFGEERGCIGSKAIAKDYSDWLKKFKRAIAFDRRGTHSVITFQHGQRCCSDVFGQAIADQLGNDYELDDTGLYTDTASYMEIIPECTNISVGYDHEHGPNETLDLEHLRWLALAVLSVNWSELPTERDPSVLEDLYDTSIGFTSAGWWNKVDNPNLMSNGDIQSLIQIANAEIVDHDAAVSLVLDEPELAAMILLAYVDRDVDIQSSIPADWSSEIQSEVPDDWPVVPAVALQ